MGTLIALEDRRRRRAARLAGTHPRVRKASSWRAVEAVEADLAPMPVPEFYFDLACPFSYLAAEQVERMLGEVEWIPVSGSAPASVWLDNPMVRARAERDARRLRLPLTWPDASSDGFRSALRVASHAAESGAGSAFALAALRFAFSGGYDLEDLEILAEAAAAAGLDPGRCLAVARRGNEDEVQNDVARHLADHGVDRLPAVQMGERWFVGDQAVAQAGAYRRAVTTADLTPSA